MKKKKKEGKGCSNHLQLDLRKEKVRLLATYLILDKYNFLWRIRRKAALEALAVLGGFDELEIRDAVYLADR